MPCRAAAGAANDGNRYGLPSIPTAPMIPIGGVDPPRTAVQPALAAPAGSRIVDLSAGPLQVRLAEEAADIDAAQALRYRVFYETMGARPVSGMARRRRDFDPFDAICDHLLVIDHSLGKHGGEVVGTYRLIRRDAARRCGRFYSSAEYDIAKLVDYPGEILELGRSCVDPRYRGRGAMQLLWGGIAAYVFHFEIALMFGCASLPGTDPDALAEPLSYLRHAHLAPPELRPRAVAERYVEMAHLMPPRSISDASGPRCRRSSRAICGSAGLSARAPSSTVSSTRRMSASWSRRTWSPRSIRATTSGQ